LWGLCDKKLGHQVKKRKKYESDAQKFFKEERNVCRSVPLCDNILIMSDIIDKESVDDLILSAREAAESAYCPYSKYPVGAAFLGVDGEIYTGCNVENAAYGLSICAERTAIFNAVGCGCRQFVAMAMAGGQKQAATPCGACRQVLVEFCLPAMPVYFANLTDGEVTETTVGTLLPLAFGKQYLK